jgi:3-oxoacyl-[acyl-carrier protein] reductase
MRVLDKVAIVTGAAQGIGQGYAELLAREGAKVALVDIQGEAAEANAAAINEAGGEAIGIAADLTDPEQIDAMVATVNERFGGIDILVNNAARYAGYTHYTLMETPMPYWRSFFEINVDAVLRTTQAVVPSMIQRGKGKIVMQSSAGGTNAGNVYGLTKLAVQGLTVGLARELGKHRICVNCIAPGVVPTQATKDHYPGDMLDQLVDRLHSIKQLATVDDMAYGLLYLASDESDMVTGQILHIDGGMILIPV